MPLSYKPAIKGKAIDSAIKSKTASLTAATASTGGIKMWTAVLEKIYNDFDTTFATSLQKFLKTAKIIFPPAISMPLQAQKPLLKMKPLASASASMLDAAIKSQTATLQGIAASTAGVITWSEFCGQVGKDLLKKTPIAICTACDKGIPTISAGFTSPPMVASLAPMAPIYTKLKPPALQMLLTPFLTTGIKALGATIDSTLKAKTSSLSGANASGGGATTWNTVLEILIPALVLEYNTKLILFMQQSTGAWMTPPAPGLPLIPPSMVPTPGAVSLPATNVLV